MADPEAETGEAVANGAAPEEVPLEAVTREVKAAEIQGGLGVAAGEALLEGALSQRDGGGSESCTGNIAAEKILGQLGTDERDVPTEVLCLGEEDPLGSNQNQR